MSEQASLARTTKELAVVVQVSELLTSLDLDDVLSKTLHLLSDTVDAERGSFFLLDHEGRTMQRIITRRDLPLERSYKVVGVVFKEGLAGWVYRNKQGGIVEDTEQDNRWVDFPDDPFPVRSVLCVPFVSNNLVNGIMTLEHTEPYHFSQSDLRLALTVANQATVAIHNAQLFDLVETQERRLFAILQNTVDPLITIDVQQRIQLVNPAALEVLGVPESAVFDTTLAEVSANPIFAEVAQQVEAGAEQFELRDEVAKRDYAVHISSWREGESDDFGRVIVLNDITTLKDLTRLKSQTLQIASHDLQNPLGVIQSYAEMILMEISEDDFIHEYASGISHSAQRMLTMISELLDLERIEAVGHTQELFSVTDVLKEIIQGEESAAAQKNLSLHCEVEPDLPMLSGDKVQIREAVRNLVSNAIKYTPEGGSVNVYAALNGDLKRFALSVEDTGLGIPKHLQGKLFQQFYRAKQPGAEEIPGTGLGLSLVKAVVEQHGGEVWFHSVAGEGSAFGFWLPVPESENGEG